MSENKEYDMKNHNERIIFQKNRLLEISNTLGRMQKKCEIYLKDFETSGDWKKFKEGFLAHNYLFKPSEVVEFQTCDLADQETGFFKPKKQKILICSNKIHNKEHFNTVMKYQLTLMYDSVRSNIDYNNCKQLACMHIRAMNLSQLCKRADKQCFETNLEHMIFKSEVCQGQQQIFDKTFAKCVTDISPYNTLKHSQSYFL